MLWLAIPPLVIRLRKKRANKKGLDYKPLFPKAKGKVDKIKNSLNLNKKRNEKII
jgi:hypothetical protein